MAESTFKAIPYANLTPEVKATMEANAISMGFASGEAYYQSRGGANAAGYYGDSYVEGVTLTDEEYAAAMQKGELLEHMALLSMRLQARRLITFISIKVLHKQKLRLNQVTMLQEYQFLELLAQAPVQLLRLQKLVVALTNSVKMHLSLCLADSKSTA